MSGLDWSPVLSDRYFLGSDPRSSAAGLEEDLLQRLYQGLPLQPDVSCWLRYGGSMVLGANF